jgi:Kef-type K+ transport system membrane component KefB
LHGGLSIFPAFFPLGNPLVVRGSQPAAATASRCAIMAEEGGAGSAELLVTWLTFFIVALAAGRIGILFPRYLALPLITGYLVVGSLAGPFALDIIHKSDLPRLSYVTQFALAFIAFSAGAELYLPELRSLFKRILYQTTAIALVTFTVCTALIMALAEAGLVPFMAGLPLGCRASVATIAASIMVARSPASAIAVVKELKAKGTFTSTLLGVTVLCDVYVLLAFTVTTSCAESACKGEGFSVAALAIVFACIAASLLIGALVGRVLLALMWCVSVACGRDVAAPTPPARARA